MTTSSGQVPSAPSFARVRAFALAAAAAVAAVAVWWGGVNQDEGWYLYAARLVNEGLSPYRDFFFTQGPALPVVYSYLSPIWTWAGSPLHGVLGGRVVTVAFSLAATAAAAALARRLVAPGRRSAAGIATFALLACNLYHAYFTAIPKTYALGAFFLSSGFLFLAAALEPGRRAWHAWVLATSAGLAMAFASGTRISLVLVLPVVGFCLLAWFCRYRWTFLFFGVGATAGLFLTYGLFACDPASLRGLLAAQAYHAARGGFDPFFALGSVSRLARGYAALGVVLFAVALALPRAWGRVRALATAPLVAMLLASFAAVFLLQLSAPFPYDDYQVPVMPLLTVALVALCAETRTEDACGPGMAWFAVLVSCLVSFSSPLLQEWATYGQDRFWSVKKEMTELAKLRAAGRRVEAADPGGTTLLTQDLYLAVETGRRVPRGMEMGPFCYFPDWNTAKAESLHVVNDELFERLLVSAPAPVAAFSGYGFAIAAPGTAETPFSRQTEFWRILKRNYELEESVVNFGQNATTLLILKRKGRVN